MVACGKEANKCEHADKNGLETRGYGGERPLRVAIDTLHRGDAILAVRMRSHICVGRIA